MRQIGFYFVVCQGEEALANRLLSQLETHFPESPVAVISDGEFARESLSLGRADFIAGEHLKTPQTIGRYSQRSLEVALSLNTDWIAKLDPDAYIRRHFAETPPADWCGTLRHPRSMSWGRTRWVQGGAWVMRQSAAQKIADSRLLLHPRYLLPQSFERNIETPYANCRLGHVATSLGLVLKGWSEIHSTREEKQPQQESAAIIHPVKRVSSGTSSPP